MKLFASAVAALLISATSYGQQYATDVTVTDCEGTSHNLFNELDAGKIIVVGWTMPCATCAAPLLDVHNAVLNFAVSNPGVVEYWMNDDYGNSTCQTVEDWCTNNGITNAIYFADAELEMLDYGSNGMPKVVVLGCSTHEVYYNQNDNFTGAHVTAAINNALDDMSNGCQAASINEIENTMSVTCYPNPASGTLNVAFDSNTNTDVTIEVVGVNGAVFSTVEANTQNEIQVNIEDLANGMYFLNVKDGSSVIVEKFQVNQ